MRTLHKLVPLFLLLAFCGSQVRSVFAQPDHITEEKYWGLIQESRSIVAGARFENKSEETIRQELDQLAARWEAVTEVEVDGKRIPLDQQYLVEMLRGNPPDLKKLDETFASLLKSRRVAPTDAFSASDLALLAEILARPEYQWAEAAPNPASDWLDRILAEINRWLNEILGFTFDVAGSDVVSVLMAILLGVVFIFIARTLLSDFMNEAQLKENGEEEPLTSESALARAQQLSRSGDYRAAVRYLYLSTLLILDERGIMRYDRSKTNREYLRSVADLPELSKPLGDVIEVFDNVWYGHHELGEDSFEHYSKRVEELKEKRS